MSEDRIEHSPPGHGAGQPVARRVLLEAGTAAAALAAAGPSATARPAAAQPAVPEPSVEPVPVTLTINGREHALALDPRTSLLDALREHLALTGSKKGCDHGQCGACTVLVDGRRINACLTLAVMHEGDRITTIEGIGAEALSPMQAAFLHHDGYQCGYCTAGQICSATGMLAEVKAGMPSAVTADLAQPRAVLTNAEIRERMSGNLCRCAAYPNIVAAIRQAAGDAA
jgi:xanthine dehydrogenase YagT iron-sulfur-binding subunit